MRTEQDVIGQLLHVARNDDKIRAVLLNGSRVNPNVARDPFCDYDVIFAVTDPHYYMQHQDWIKSFGELIIMQQNTLHDPDGDGYIFLMLFDDGVRIDLSFRYAMRVNSFLDDSLTMVLLDKDNIIPQLDPPSDRSYLTRKPTEKQFDEAVNEFWWCSTNVAKGLWRAELPYVKYMFDVVVRNSMVALLAWYAGMNNGWRVNTGKAGKWLEKHLPSEIWNSYVKTYAGSDYEEIWEALFEAGRLTHAVGTELADHLGYHYPFEDERKVTEYLRRIRMQH
jgi:aminoglycoside 6-adenylyltransferase